jgi:hypothetical protein
VASVPRPFSKLEFSNLAFRHLRGGSQVSKARPGAPITLSRRFSHRLGRAGTSINDGPACPGLPWECRRCGTLAAKQDAKTLFLKGTGLSPYILATKNDGLHFTAVRTAQSSLRRGRPYPSHNLAFPQPFQPPMYKRFVARRCRALCTVETMIWTSLIWAPGLALKPRFYLNDSSLGLGGGRGGE